VRECESAGVRECGSARVRENNVQSTLKILFFVYIFPEKYYNWAL